ncbi:hypothetical protein ULO1_24060 [Carboxydocella sp. ULO1]|nr:hypothetical protein ULO1_24060 [Carboxydocella sp. ULO1]
MKRKSMSLGGCPSRGFEPTYEELKLIYRALCVCGPRGFEPTYEELKRI